MPLADHADNLADVLSQMFPKGVHRKSDCGHAESDHTLLSVSTSKDPGIKNAKDPSKWDLAPGTRYQVDFTCGASFGTNPRTKQPEVHGRCSDAIVIPD